MPRTCLALACLLLSSAAVAQNATAPANVIVPALPPREGTVGPEQLRDFALPGTRTPAPTTQQEPASAPPTAPVQRPDPTPAPATSQTAPAPARTAPSAAERETPSAPATTDAPVSSAPPAIAAPAPEVTPSLPLPSLSEPPLSAPTTEPLTSTGTASGLAWWPWLVVAALAGIGLALLLRRRRRLALADGVAEEYPVAPVPDVPQPAAPTASVAPRGAPPAEAPVSRERPEGLVTTKLRPAARPVSDPVPAPAPVGGIVSRRLRPWIDLDLAVREILLTETDAIIRFDLAIVNGGAAPARSVVVEAVAINAGEQQSDELRIFFARPPSTTDGISEIPPMGTASVSHELRMPRSAIRAYDAQGRTLFVPILAFNATYRAGSGEGLTSAAYLVGRHNPASDRLVPLPLEDGPRRILGLAARRLEDAVRR